VSNRKLEVDVTFTVKFKRIGSETTKEEVRLIRAHLGTLLQQVIRATETEED
jgi:hypothetical protein